MSDQANAILSRTEVVGHNSQNGFLAKSGFLQLWREPVPRSSGIAARSHGVWSPAAPGGMTLLPPGGTDPCPQGGPPLPPRGETHFPPGGTDPCPQGGDALPPRGKKHALRKHVADGAPKTPSACPKSPYYCPLKTAPLPEKTTWKPSVA